MKFDSVLKDYEERRYKALAMGGPEKLDRRRALGILNARERIDYLVDKSSFTEAGLFGTSSVVPDDRDKTPTDGKVSGFAEIAGRRIGIISNDFTVKGASSSLTNMKKIGHIKRVATQRGFPLVFLGESSGARMPDNMGSAGMGTLLGNDPAQYQRKRESPWASAVLGYCFGSSAWYTCMSDFAVMRKGAVLAVGSPQLASLATGETVEPDELGGWRLHSETTGIIDRITNTDEEALDLIGAFLSYLPSNQSEAPPRHAVPSGSEEAVKNVIDILPEKRTQVYDVRKVIKAVIDKDSFFEFKPKFARVAVTCLARLNGKTVGIIANNPLVKGGALTAQACEKITRFIVLCDSFNIPIILFVDTPGFVIGKEGERQKVPGKIINVMNALSLVTVPKLSVILRKSYGQAYLNMGGGRNSDEVAAWPTAEISFMDPVFATRVVTMGQVQEKEVDVNKPVFERMDRDCSVWDIASIYSVQYVILPQQTRNWLIDMLDVHESKITGGVGQHLMSAWPTTF